MARYALTIFISALLLFQVQPLLAKYILPWFGGGPSVWTTCMLFFQLLLLGGYAYAHLLNVRFSLRRQGMVHLTLVIASLALLPIVPSEQLKPEGSQSPVAAILLVLCLTVGGPYFLLSSTGPLMQRWFSRSFVGRSPYRLYSLSNFGSLLALLSYPLVIEPMLSLRQQVGIWSVLYAVFGVLAVACSVGVMKLDDEPSAAASPADEVEAVQENMLEQPGLGRMLLWLGLAAVGSMMLLATTNQMCIDVAVVPLLWVLPLSLYLLTFVICFDNPRWYDRRVFGLLLAAAAAAALWQLHRGVKTSIPDLVCIYCGVMFVCCMCCHGELVKSRPHPKYLTLFYLLVSAGGALGGLLVAVVAPAVFTGFWEFHVSVGGACAMTLIAWHINRAWQGRYCVVFWTWAVVSAVQIGIVIQVLYVNHADSFVTGDLSLLLGVIGVIHLIAWVVTANAERQPRTLAILWTAVTIGQLGWVIGFIETRLDHRLGIDQYAWLSLTGVAAVLGWLVGRLIGRRVGRPTRRWVFLGGLHLVIVIGLVVLAIQGTLSLTRCGVIAGVYLALSIVVFLTRRSVAEPILQHNAWFLPPTVTVWVLLVTELFCLVRDDGSGSIYMSRNFYGVLRVKIREDDNGEYYCLTHGVIQHGTQYIDDFWRLQPTTYYGPGTGVDLAMRLHPRRFAENPQERSLRVGVVGLGTGSIAAQGVAGDSIRFYDINRDVAAVSDEYFSYLRDSPADTEVVIGDARIVLERELASGLSQPFDVLAIDAFSSDAIPIHLLTAQCGDLYRKHLRDDGLLLIHISNRYLDLNPVARGLAQHLGWQAVRIHNDDDDPRGVNSAEWIIIAANDEFLFHSEVQDAHSPWDEDEPQPLLWTDDFAGLWQVIYW